MTGAAVPRRWWETHWFALALIAAATVPLLYPPVPPLVDGLGHLGRFRIILGGSAFLDQFYSVHWAPIGNLGTDLIVLPLARVIGLESAFKLVVLAIPPLTVAGMLSVSRAVHGRLPPTAAFAVPLAYAQPFLFGFLNFALSMALALLAFALWLDLARRGRLRLRAALFVPVSLALYFAHIFGWAVLGLLALGAELVRRRDLGQPPGRNLLGSVLAVSVMAFPILIMVLTRGDAGALTKGWFDLPRKAGFVAGIFRDRWLVLDLLTVILPIVLLSFARTDRRMRFAPTLVAGGGLLGLALLMLPGWLFGSAFADMRLAPFVLLALVLAIAAPADGRLAGWLAIGATAFALARLAVTTASLIVADRQQTAQVVAIDAIAPRSRVAVLVDHPCRSWALPRNDHLGSLALVRRDSFTNDQWALQGGTLVAVHYAAARGIDSDDSQIVGQPACGGLPAIGPVIARIPADAFDYLWLIDAGEVDVPATWRLRWNGPGSRLYVRAGPAAAAPPPATPRTASAPAR